MWMDLIEAMLQKQKDILNGLKRITSDHSNNDENISKSLISPIVTTNTTTGHNRTMSDLEVMTDAGSLTSNIDIIMTTISPKSSDAANSSSFR